jgi:D-3-phosphoglycerate dehydrogenase / 2-oxoglutarate reductase
MRGSLLMSISSDFGEACYERDEASSLTRFGGAGRLPQKRGNPMAPNTKRVFYVKYVAAPIFLEILARRPDVQVDRLENDIPAAIAEPVLAAAHAYQIGAARDEIVMDYHATESLLARAPNLLAVSSNGAGFDTVDVDACTAAGVIAVNQAGGNKEAVAEHVLAMMLTLSKRIVETDRYMRRQSDIPRNDFIGHDLTGRTVGIIGLGNVGSRVAELCRGLFRMRVLAFDPYLTEQEIAARGGEKVTLDALLAQSDYVSVNCPRNTETRNMIGAAQYAQMQKHAYFITTARGGIHDEAALAEALAAHRIAGAGLDVWEKEPPPHTHPLMAFDNVVISPHTAGVTVESRNNIARIAAEQMLDILDGKRPPRLLNPAVWPAYCERFQRILGFSPPR